MKQIGNSIPVLCHTSPVIDRVLALRLESAARQFPVVTVTGPRQSGKTTLCRRLFPERKRVSLEDPDVRQRALADPRGFLSAYPAGAFFDEVQRVPDLLSYLQGVVDEGASPGSFILSGSQHFGLLESVSQSLAGRTAVLHLLAPELVELRRFRAPPSELFEALWKGAYPRIHDQRIDAREWLGAYVATYVERDVRQVLRVADLAAFQTFLALCAGRAGQVLNFSSLASDCGIDAKTARAWLGVLETSFLAFRVRPFARNLGKRWIKAPKLYFFDAGLLCYLLGIRAPEELRTHPLRGSIFESWVVSEVYKARVHRGVPPELYFIRDSRGFEIDLIVLDGTRARVVEMKSGQTVSPSFLAPLRAFAELLRERDPLVTEVEQLVVHGGADEYEQGGATVLPWNRIDGVDWARTAT